MVDALYIVEVYDEGTTDFLTDKFNHLVDAERWCYDRSRRTQYEYNIYRKTNHGYEFECKFVNGKQEW